MTRVERHVPVLELCSDCKLGKVDITGQNWLAVTEALTSLSSAYPGEEAGQIPDLSDEELEAYRLLEIAEWRQEGEFGKPVAQVLIEVPEIVKANYLCDRRRAAGACVVLAANRAKREKGE